MPKIHRRRSTPDHCLPRATFSRLIREIGHDLRPNLKWSHDAIQALQDDAEQLLAERFARAGALSAQLKNKTVGARHFQLAAR